MDMQNRIFHWLAIRYPQNFIIRYPVRGAIIEAIVVFGFVAIYKPLNTHASGSLSFAVTMAVYGVISSASVIPACFIIKLIERLSGSKEWTITKELLSDLFILLVIGITTYFLGFLVETTGPRWNMATFINSIAIGSLLSIIPIIFCTGMNYRYLFSPEDLRIELKESVAPDPLPQENLIEITSQLIKEELSFYPSEFIYAESDGNYVDFYLLKENIVRKEIIRNSINNIEKQLSGVPYFFRTHRAFIVNLKKVKSKQGNTLGYLIKFDETEKRIPVSRQNTHTFNQHLVHYNR
jgi:hypothetical protein